MMDWYYEELLNLISAVYVQALRDAHAQGRPTPAEQIEAAALLTELDPSWPTRKPPKRRYPERFYPKERTKKP